MKLTGRVAVVTGAGSGIGAAISTAFALEGAVLAVTDVCVEAARNVTDGICGSGGSARAVTLDITNHEAVENAADRIEQELGPISVWVNNAGVSYIVPFLECSEDLWNRTLDTNLKGTFFGCQAAIRRMLPRRRGVVINMASQSGKAGNSQYGAYCASKFGIIGLTQSLAMEFARDGIRVNALCPGVVMTPLWDRMIDDYARKRNLQRDQVRPYLEAKIPMGRLCEPEDVARTAVFLASDDSAYLTGQALNVSGGAVMH